MTQRAWRQLIADAYVPRDYDAALRMALAACAADPQSPLSPADRQWVIGLAGQTTRFTAEERLKLKEPLLTWLKATMPRCVEIVAPYFEETQ
jgi:hypothetical protein